MLPVVTIPRFIRDATEEGVDEERRFEPKELEKLDETVVVARTHRWVGGQGILVCV